MHTHSYWLAYADELVVIIYLTTKKNTHTQMIKILDMVHTFSSPYRIPFGRSLQPSHTISGSIVAYVQNGAENKVPIYINCTQHANTTHHITWHGIVSIILFYSMTLAHYKHVFH